VADVEAWQSRPLDPIYAVVLIDAIVVKVRDTQVTNRPVYVAIGVDLDGERDVLGLWMGPLAGRDRPQRPTPVTFSDLWKPHDAIEVPIMLARGMLPQSVVRDEDEADLLAHKARHQGGPLRQDRSQPPGRHACRAGPKDRHVVFG
jgi:hypothetical protein